MSVSNTTSKTGPYNANGVQTVFPFAFKAFSKNDLRVVLTTISAFESDLIVDTQFTVALNADQNASPGGSVTTAATYAAGYVITVVSNLTPNQLVSLTNFRPDVIEKAFDKLTLLVQQLFEQTSRSVKTAVSSTTTADSLLTSIAASVTTAASSATAASASATAASGIVVAAGISATNASNSAAAAAASAAIFTLASQAEAETGTDNSKYMSALRVKQSIVFNVPAAFPSGTRMPFNQTAAPTGWTKDVTAALNDSIMRIVTGTVASGGSTAFSTFNGQTATAAYTLAIADIPSHTHTYTTNGAIAVTTGKGSAGGSAGATTGATGGGGAHSHGMTTAIKYNDFIIAIKN